MVSSLNNLFAVNSPLVILLFWYPSNSKVGLRVDFAMDNTRTLFNAVRQNES
jgi:hypothetical protein